MHMLLLLLVCTMELQLGLALPTTNPLDLNKPLNKRSFSQFTFDHHNNTLPTLSLLPLTPDHCSTSITTNSDESDDVEGPLMGWPPVNSWRKKLRVRDDDGSVSSNAMYVKVKMEGVGIARKVNLSIHYSFQALKHTLFHMFGKCHQFSKRYELAYQDEEGDWLLAEDVPWRTFIQCAQRLKLLKSRSG